MVDPLFQHLQSAYTERMVVYGTSKTRYTTLASIYEIWVYTASQKKLSLSPWRHVDLDWILFLELVVRKSVPKNQLKMLSCFY